MSFLIAAIYGEIAGATASECPVLSIGSSVDSGYIIESVLYHTEALAKRSCRSEYSGRPENPEDFNIGLCSFVKIKGEWYLKPDPTDNLNLHKIVYGQNSLESYGSGEMFRRLEQMFGGD